MSLEYNDSYVGTQAGSPTFFSIEQGAHNYAVDREIKLRNQRPNTQLSGRAGDQLIRDPK